jgi:hypothetical protein
MARYMAVCHSGVGAVWPNIWEYVTVKWVQYGHIYGSMSQCSGFIMAKYMGACHSEVGAVWPNIWEYVTVKWVQYGQIYGSVLQWNGHNMAKYMGACHSELSTVWPNIMFIVPKISAKIFNVLSDSKKWTHVTYKVDKFQQSLFPTTGGCDSCTYCALYEEPIE